MGPMDDDPRPEHDDGFCVDVWCPYEALFEDGVRMSYCAAHRQQFRAYELLPAFAERLTQRPNVVHSLLLSERERAWLPQNSRQQSQEWPTVGKVEAFSNSFVHMMSGWNSDAWTWRSVAMAARAFPDRPVRLVGSTIYIPQVPPISEKGL